MKLVLLLMTAVVVVSAKDLNAVEQLVNGNLLFSAKTYTELANASKGNFLVCPLSVEVILALVEAGAGGTTATQLISGLNLPENEDTIQAAFKTIAPSLNADGSYTLSSANKVYLKEGFKIKEHFKEVATKVFNAEIQNVDFTKSDAVTKINNWVLEKTHDKIKDLLSTSDVDEHTSAVLINALYFHGAWANPFYPEGTREKPFHISSTKEVKVKIMEQTDRFNYCEDTTLNAKFLEMYYSEAPISMVFVLPNDIDGLPALEANIDKVLAERQFTNEKVHVQIPRVHVEQKIDFKPILQKFGVIEAFESSANFSGISANEEDKIQISKIIQKTFIDVEEKGTTAAASTAVIFQFTSSGIFPTAPPKEFEANHPFIFYVKSSTGILFIGRYVSAE